ncbi:MAG: AAA family ATPase [Bacteroidota bacterium]
MVLEYVWIEEYGIIKNQGFNFNPNVYYSFNQKNGELSKEVKNEIPIDFFNISNDTITSISALVGANGTGKSTVLEFISSFLTIHRPLGGFIVTSDQVINKSDNTIKLSKKWTGGKLEILNRLDLINNHRKESVYNKLEDNEDTKNDRLGLKILGNIVNDTRVIYYTGEANLQHTNRVYQTLWSLADEFENSHFSDISDIAMMSRDQESKRSNKAIYSGENPILTYRSGESQRFIDLMLSDFKNLIPFSLDSLSIVFSFNDIDTKFFESYDEMAFSAIMSLLKIIMKNTKDLDSSNTIQLIEEIENLGIGGYFQSKLFNFEKNNANESLKIHLYHHLLLRHVREQLMETMGELTEKNKLNRFVELLTEIEKSFTGNGTYFEQIVNYFKSTKFAHNQTGSLSLKAVDIFYNDLIKLNLWEYEKFTVGLSKPINIKDLLSALNTFNKDSELKYDVISIFDLDIRGLSTGEKQFLKTFSRFVTYNLNNKHYRADKHFIILIDEFEIGFHPLWQRKFLNTWISFLEKFINQLPENKIKVQIILTSHSPFIVSDLPKQCINFLSKKEGEKYSKVENLNEHHDTFGANIHELFSDSFFLTGALMGDFAKAKIDKIFESLNGKESIPKSSTISSLIQIIGEPIIKTKLAEMFAEKTGGNIEFARLKAQQDYINRRLIEIERNDSN